MTATTPYFGWPYPQASDARGAGAATVQQLATQVELDSIPALFDALMFDGSIQNATAADAVVDVPGAKTFQGEFSEVDGTVTYDGKTRLFVVTGGFTMNGEQGSPQVATLWVGGAARVKSVRAMPPVDSPGTLDPYSHALTWVGMIPAGATVYMTASEGSLGPIQYPRLSIASVSPGQS